jgi:hypothetical protein
MGPNLRNWWGLGVAAAVLAVPSAQAGDRKPGAAREATPVAAHHMTAPLRPTVAADVHVPVSKAEKPGEVAYVPVRPLEARLVVSENKGATGDRARSEQPSGRGAEHRGVTLFRVNPKFGDISVRPVFGGVNGAQVSVGF